MSAHLAHESSYRGTDIVSNRSSKRVVLLGVGALGSWLSELLVRQGYHDLVLVDFDKIEKSNFGTQNYGHRDVGRNKSSQCAANIYLKLGVKIESLDIKVTAENIKKATTGASLVADLFDNVASRLIVQEFCTRNSIPCLHAGVGVMGFCEARWNESCKISVPIQNNLPAPCDVPIASNLIWMCATLTAEVINRFIDSDKKTNVEFWLSSLVIDKPDNLE